MWPKPLLNKGLAGMIFTSRHVQFLWEKRCHVLRPRCNSAIELLSCTLEPGNTGFRQTGQEPGRTPKNLQRRHLPWLTVGSSPIVAGKHGRLVNTQQLILRKHKLRSYNWIQFEETCGRSCESMKRSQNQRNNTPLKFTSFYNLFTLHPFGTSGNRSVQAFS